MRFSLSKNKKNLSSRNQIKISYPNKIRKRNFRIKFQEGFFILFKITLIQRLVAEQTIKCQVDGYEGKFRKTIFCCSSCSVYRVRGDSLTLKHINCIFPFCFNFPWFWSSLLSWILNEKFQIKVNGRATWRSGKCSSKVFAFVQQILG